MNNNFMCPHGHGVDEGFHSSPPAVASSNPISNGAPPISNEYSPPRNPNRNPSDRNGQHCWPSSKDIVD